MTKHEALQNFWSSFGWKAYNGTTVPDSALSLNDDRYITYEGASDNIDSIVYVSASLWHRSRSQTVIHAKSEEISRYIEMEMSPALPYDGGLLKIRKGVPFSLDVDSGDPDVRRVRLNLELEFLSIY